ncbi:MAG: hypothetical protein NW241_19020 [Bacteroidia bacterium]|nr:hypothetical protein [Bacteroidia bacterium]
MSILRSSVLFLLTFLGCLLVLELYVSSAEIDLSYHELNPVIGKKMLPNKRIVMLKEGFYLGQTNEYGYLGPAYPKEKPDSVFRIALMGNSYAEGFQLWEKYHFSRILERELSARTGKTVQLLNFGSGNLNFHDMYIYYRNWAKEFNPDLVLYVVKSENMKERTSYFIPSPYFYLDPDSALQVNYDFTGKSVYQTYDRFSFLMENSVLVKMSQNAYKLAQKGRAPQILFDKLYDSYAASKQKKDELEKDPEAEIKDLKLTAVTEAIFDEMSAEGKTLFVCRDAAPAFPEELLRARGIPMVFVNDTLHDLKAAGIDPYLWKSTGRKGHWNYEGNEAVGHFLAEKLAPLVP